MEEFLDFFIEPLKKLFLYFNIELNNDTISVILGVFFTIIIPKISKLFKKFFKYCKSLINSKDLHPFFTKYQVRQAIKFYIHLNGQSIDPTNEDEPRNCIHAKEKLIPLFLKLLNPKSETNHDQDRFYIVLADSGMGKTTFAINLYISLNRKVLRKKYKPKLFPFGYDNLIEEINKVEEKDEKILLLDGFDEDTKAQINYKKRLEEIMSVVSDFRCCILTSRTQFFTTQEEEPVETSIRKFYNGGGYELFEKIYISPFSSNDIKKYLRKKLSWYRFKKYKQAYKIVKNAPNIFVRPMLLSHIEDLINDNQNISLTYNIYEILVNKWYDREAIRITHEERKEFLDNLKKFTFEFTLYLNKNNIDRIPFNEISNFKDRHNIDLDELTMRNRSLLNRDSKGNFKFAHKSIFEFYLAKYVTSKHIDINSIDTQKYNMVTLFLDDYKYIEHANFISLFNVEQRKKFYDPYNSNIYDIKTLLNNESLFFEGYNLRDIVWLNSFINIKKLSFCDNQIEDISVIFKFNNLKWLNLAHNEIKDISSISNLVNLNTLYLNSNNINDIKPLSNLINLKNLNIENNPIEDLSPILNLKKLRRLQLSKGNFSKEELNLISEILKDCVIF